MLIIKEIGMIRKSIQSIIAVMSFLIFAIPASAISISVSSRYYNSCVGSELTFKVIVEDATVTSYQWYKDNAIVSGATSDIFTIASVAASDAGNYFCRVSYNSTYQDSENIQVEVTAGLPTITSATANANSLCEGTSLTLTGVATNATGKAWFFGENRLDVGATYSIASVGGENTGVYTFQASNACGTITSSPVNVEVIMLPRIVTHPESQIICEGEDLSMSVVATGSNLSYQWKYGDTNYPAANGSDQTANLLISNVVYGAFSYSTQFKVEVSNTCQTVVSNGAVVQTRQLPVIQTHPSDVDVCQGENVHFTTYASSNPNDEVTYAWYVNETEIENTNSENYSFIAQAGGTVKCKITNSCGSVFTEEATLAVRLMPSIERQPEAGTYCVGDQIVLNIKANGAEPISFKWKYCEDEGVSATTVYHANTSGVSSSTLTINNSNIGNIGYYFCKVTNGCGDTNTDTVFIDVKSPVTIYPQPTANQTVCDGSELVLSVEGSVLGSDPFTYAWRKSGSESVLSSTNNLTFTNIALSDAGLYHCDVTNVCGTVSTNNITVSVLAGPHVVSQSAGLSVCVNNSFTLSVEAQGQGIQYLWYRDGSMISAANSDTYSVAQANVSHAGNYTCVVRSNLGCPSDTSAVMRVDVVTVPSIESQPVPVYTTICAGEPFNLSMQAEGEVLSYQWYCNNNPISGQTSSSLHIGNAYESQAGTYYCVVSNACTDIQSETATLSVNESPSMTLGPDLNLCHGQHAIIGPVSGEFNHYVWNNGIYGNTPTLDVTLDGDYILEVTDAEHGSCVTRDTIRVNFHDYFDIAFDEGTIETCGSVLLNAGLGAASYSWSTGEDQFMITVTESGTYSVTVDAGYGCTSSQTVNIVIGQQMTIDLGEDIHASVENEVEIGVAPVFETYRWNTGYTGPKLTVSGDEYGLGSHLFWIEVTNGGCSARDSINVIFISDGHGGDDDAVEVNEFAKLKVYPNPASDFVNVISDAEISKIQLFDILGRLVQEFDAKTTEATINVSNLCNGEYLLKVISADNSYSVNKIIVR